MTETIATDKQSFVCDHTGQVVDSTRIPKGWKRFGEKLYSAKAVKELFALRAVSLPIRWSDDEEWTKAVRATLKRGFRYATSLANWFTTQFYALDVRRTPELEKLPKFTVGSLYQNAKERFPLDEVPSGLLAAMENKMRGNYTARRYDVVWTCSKSLQNYRYPAPYPVRGQDWNLKMDEDGNLSVNVNIMRQRLVLPLSQSYKFRRQRDGLKSILAAGSRFGELVINENRKGQVFCRIAGYFPRLVAKGRTGTLFVRSAPESLIIALNSKDQRLWIYHGDHARRWVKEHRRNIQRWADDTKYEDRPRPGFAERREAAGQKFRRRMSELTHQVSARIVNYAIRRRFSEIELDLTNREFVDRFPWQELKRKAIEKAEFAGIAVKVMGD